MSEAKKLPQVRTVQVDVGMVARDRISLTVMVDEGNEITSASLKGVGCSELLELLSSWRAKLSGPLASLPLPDGNGHAAILMREVILKAQGSWSFPYEDEELCHCRAVPTKRVDDAIIGGCHTPEAVSRATRASTSCGTCRPDVEKILAYRLRK